MPFKSEAQRKYLWANEPAIARDWTDTYGSGIHKAKGGRIGFAEGWTPGAGRDKQGYQSSHTSYSGGDKHPSEKYGTTTTVSHTPKEGPKIHIPKDTIHHPNLNITPAAAKSYITKTPKDKYGIKKHEELWGKEDDETDVQQAKDVQKGWMERYEDWYQTQTDKAIQSSIDDLASRIEGYKDYRPGRMSQLEGYGYDFSGLPEGKAKLGSNIGTSIESWRDNPYTVNMNMPSLLGGIGDKIRPDTKVTAQNTLDALRTYQKGRGTWTQKDYEEFRDRNKPPSDIGGEGGQAEWQRLGYPSLAAYQAAMGGGGGGAIDEVVDDTDDLGSGHFKVPSQYVLAEGGRIGYDGGQLVQPGLGRPGYGGPHETEAAGKSYEKAASQPGGGDAWQRQALQQFATLPTRVSTPRPDPEPTPDRFPDRGIRAINPPINSYINKGPSTWDNIKNFISWNTDDDDTPVTGTTVLGAGAADTDDAKRDLVENSILGSLTKEKAHQLIDYNQSMADKIKSADLGFNQGGRAGYQEGNMVGAEMEGAEMENAMMQSQEVIKELYDAFIAQGLSPQEAIEKIKQIIASSQTEGPQSPMMGEEFPGQEFGGGPRASAAFGGIMDTYTGRRKYGLGSFFKKAFKKVKKLASSKLGKLALMYAAGTYLGGTQAFGGTGWGSGAGATPWKKFGAKLLDPTGGQGIGNIFNPTGGLGKGKGWGIFQGADTAAKAASKVAGKGDWSKYILPASIGAGYLADKMPADDLDDVSGEWDEKKEAFDKYLASLDTGDSYRVPQEYIKSAEGGRIGRQEGGLMDLGGMEKDYRNDGGFVPLGGEEKADDVPARLSRNEFVFTADAVRNAGGGDIDKGAEVMENVMKNLEAGGQVSEESQGQGAQDMFEVSERLSEVV
jgi:hypothetical protein